jgi:hypothetical protein
LNSHSAGTAAQILVLSSKSERTQTHQTGDRLVAELTDETLLSFSKAGEKESLGSPFRRYAPSVADEWVTQTLRQRDAQVFKKYSQLKLQMKREALQKPNRRANEVAPVAADVLMAAPMCTVMVQ